jgi:WbqC-like protein family
VRLDRLSPASGDSRSAAIMQPYFMPYIGYFQLIASVDVFVVYDNIKYTKKGWINRNRILREGQATVFSLPLKGDRDALDICEREIAADFEPTTLLNRVAAAYRRAPFFLDTFPLVEQVIRYEERNLFRFLAHSISSTCEHLGIATETRRSSDVPSDHRLRAQDRVLGICEAVGATVYVNAIGGRELYSVEDFRARGIELLFIRSKPVEYSQFGLPFVPSLSIIDVLMFNPIEVVQQWLRTGYDLV